MKKTLLISTAFVATLATVIVTTENAHSNSGGRSGMAGSPGESTCTSCHGAQNTATTTIATTIPTSGYLANTAYTIDITIAAAGKTAFGFCFEAMDSATNVKQGTFTAGTGNKTSGTTTKPCVTHNGNALNGTGTKTYTFTWTSPATATKVVKFYCAGLAANGNFNDDSGDWTALTSAIVHPATTTAIPQNSIAINAVNTFPNPCTDIVNVAYSTTKSGVVNISIYDTKGALITNVYNAYTALGDHLETINVDNLQAGIYLVAVQQNNVIKTQQIQVTK